jgi:hypothetical protein
MMSGITTPSSQDALMDILAVRAAGMSVIGLASDEEAKALTLV